MTIMLLLAVPGILFNVQNGRAQEQPEVAEEKKETPGTNENKPGEQVEDEDLKPEVFIPTDELSEDKDIAFPTNI